jgi:hypothetical protein
MPPFDRHQPIGRLPSLLPAPLFPARHVQSHVSLSPPQEHIAGVGVLAADAGHHTAAYEPVSQQDRSPQKVAPLATSLGLGYFSIRRKI